MELERVRSWFKPASKVLEIGGGNGYQAGIISSWGCAVVAVDVACPRGETYRKSVLYDGVKFGCASRICGTASARAASCRLTTTVHGQARVKR
jgi:protein-L-isoaspartate O-methyltransferase